MVKGSHLVINTGVRGCRALLHSLIIQEFYDPKSFRQRATPFRIESGIQVQDAECQGPQRIRMLGCVVVLDILGAAFKAGKHGIRVILNCDLWQNGQPVLL